MPVQANCQNVVMVAYLLPHCAPTLWLAVLRYPSRCPPWLQVRPRGWGQPFLLSIKRLAATSESSFMLATAVCAHFEQGYPCRWTGLSTLSRTQGAL